MKYLMALYHLLSYNWYTKLFPAISHHWGALYLSDAVKTAIFCLIFHVSDRVKDSLHQSAGRRHRLCLPLPAYPSPQ